MLAILDHHLLLPCLRPASITTGRANSIPWVALAKCPKKWRLSPVNSELFRTQNPFSFLSKDTAVGILDFSAFPRREHSFQGHVHTKGRFAEMLHMAKKLSLALAWRGWVACWTAAILGHKDFHPKHIWSQVRHVPAPETLPGWQNWNSLTWALQHSRTPSRCWEGGIGWLQQTPLT